MAATNPQDASHETITAKHRWVCIYPYESDLHRRNWTRSPISVIVKRTCGGVDDAVKFVGQAGLIEMGIGLADFGGRVFWK